MTVDTGQHDGTHAQAGHPGAASTDDNRPPASEPDDQNAERDDDTDDDQGDQGGRRNREAQYRRRAQAAEAERDELRGQLDTLHRQIIGDITSAYGLPEVDLLQTAGHELSSFIGEDGTVNTEKVIDAVRSTITRYGIRPRPRRPAPNAQQGQHGTPGGVTGLGSVINKALGRNG